MKESNRYIGLDDSRDAIQAAVAEAGRGEEVREHGAIPNTPEALRKLVRRLGRPKDLHFVYEAGPSGYGIYRELIALGANCIVAAPSQTPRRAGERIKSDRRDAVTLARPVVTALTAHRGVSVLVAATTVAELGDLTRFDRARPLMGFVGLVPSLNATGLRHRTGAITKTGNAHVRRCMVEAAWAYRHPARRTAHLKRRLDGQPKVVQEIAWKAQLRLCGRYRRMVARGVNHNKVITAIARELVGFLWATARAVATVPAPVSN